jgi:adenylate kinase family enzyme
MMDRGRSDDTSEAIKKRIAFYYEETLPWINHFAEQFPLHKIDGNRSIEAVAKDVFQIIND